MIKDIKAVALQAKVPKTLYDGEEQILKFIKEATKEQVDIVGLPEDCLGPWVEIKNNYDPFKFLSSVALDNEVYLFGATQRKEEAGQRVNTGFLFDRDGNLLAKHNKVVLTPPEEDDGITPGKTIEVFETEFGKMALLVCKDSFHRYAAWFFDQLKKAGVDIVLIPSYSLNISRRSVDLWVDSLSALAKWFDVYIIAPGTIGPNGTDYPSFGHALIICPNRGVLTEGSSDKEEILRATLDVKSLEEIRNTYGSKWQPKDVPKVTLL